MVGYMMASSRNISVGFILFCVFYFSSLYPEVAPSISTEPEVRRSFFRELLRVKRQECADGTYKHGDMNCCRCAAGQHLKRHCTKTPDDGVCELCIDGETYQSEPNYDYSCHLCSSCSHENANLEVLKECTPYEDTTCKCKEGHFCPDPTGVCKICHPCDPCESTGVKEVCTPSSNTVCHEKSTGLKGGEIAGIVISVLVVVAAGVAVAFRKKISGLFKSSSVSSSPSNPVNVPLLPVDMENHLQDVAEILGWKDMRAIALKSNIPVNVIEDLALSHPNDSEMWTIDLLKRWVEMKGATASVDLIKILRERNQNAKADKIVRLLYGSDPS